MKKSLSILSVLALVLLTSCNKTLPKPEEINVNPSPLTVVGGQVNAEITGTFPVKKFVKKGVLTVTPVLKYGANEVVGEPVVYVGEKAKENGKTVSYKNGGTYKQKFSCAYQPQMAKSELYLRFEAKIGKKTIEIPDVKVADGMMATATLAKAQDNKTQVTPDKFQRVIQELQEADIKFLIQQANLRNSETASQAVKNLQAAIKEANDAENKEISKIEVAGYASPDGAQGLNENLAQQRQKVTQNYLKKQLKRAKIDATIDSKITAEDWEGFRQLMENSNIQDKELVLRVLSMYTDPEERENQIKNLSAVYKTIADEILPALRRSRLILTTDLIGKSDDEITELAANNPAELSVEELLYAATLKNDANEKAKIYQKVMAQYPDDYRAYNNMGMIYFEQGNIAEARRSYGKALELDANNADVNYNAGVAAMADNDLAKAEEYLGKAAGTSADLGAAMGTYYTMKGDYNNAKKSYGTAATNNAAVQQILNEDYAAARQTLANVAEPNATTAYLTAVVAARTNDRDAVYANLKTAIAKDASFKAKAAEDIEFAKFAGDDAFLAIVK
ncbi:MAG: tetratricopeptide repeat protein [Paludibacter sp.]|nr:tetratricopeptide repeat protein [Bacteroidales bacterium]MCM1069377.1 tetratricopeptide repeat protein [Prevotella sp.]MCM1353897.1 tetratricopeptide repeat protein [Bacteroides sp.]MCM1442853.1 tetratricopeptide repeat protein [Muribaculum sp.]MCM1481898.1 tetratricopeptide repeat protein [Paludibacter sp.]